MVESGATAAEIDAIDFSIEEAHAAHQGSWLDLFRGTYLRRSVIAALLFWFQETMGGQFVNSYGPTFFKDMGLGSMSFLYGFLANLAGFIGAGIVTLTTDRLGRRPLLIFGMTLCVLFNFLIAGLGGASNPDELSLAAINVVIASTVLLTASVKLSAGTMAYLVSSEVGGVRMRKKSKPCSSASYLVPFGCAFC